MHPLLFSAGPIMIYSFSFFIVLAWFVYSFIFWIHLRNNGVEDDKIFDITFFQTISVFVAARLGYVLAYPDFFSGQLLTIFALWVIPGFSFTGAVLGLVVSTAVMAKKLKVRLGYCIDALAISFPSAYIVGNIAALLDGTSIGKPSGVWGVSYIGHSSLRHPVQLYSIVYILILLSVHVLIVKKARTNRWPHGLSGIVFFLLFSLGSFVIEFLMEDPIRLGLLNIKQWMYIAIFSESLGILYVKFGGKNYLYTKYRSIYDSVSRKFTRKYQKET